MSSHRTHDLQARSVPKSTAASGIIFWSREFILPNHCRKVIIDHVSLFETLRALFARPCVLASFGIAFHLRSCGRRMEAHSKTHRNLIIQMYNEITNSITICTTKVFNISEHWISIKLQGAFSWMAKREERKTRTHKLDECDVGTIYCTICSMWRGEPCAFYVPFVPSLNEYFFLSLLLLKYQINWRYYRARRKRMGEGGRHASHTASFIATAFFALSPHAQLNKISLFADKWIVF